MNLVENTVEESGKIHDNDVLTCVCVELLVNIYLFRTSFMSMAWLKAPSVRSFGPPSVPSANCAAILIAIAAAAAAASEAVLLSFSSGFVLSVVSSSAGGPP